MAKKEDPLIEQYLQQVARKSRDPKPYDRLMIHYRHHKKLRAELQLIEKAINFFTAQFEQRQHHSAAVKRLSRLIGSSTGLMDKKGKQLYIPGPLHKWMRRKKIVVSKLRKKKKK